ncbi:MAG: gamma-glutamyl-gamma-aminobutyrate hydrolase family protein [Wolinella sp.]
MKKVAITQRLISAQEYIENREALDVRWGELLFGLGVMPLSLSYAIPFSDYAEEFAISGVILSGGNDLNSVISSAINKKRDSYERDILHYALAHRVPLLGVCRGAQFIASELGGEIRACENHVGRHEILWCEGEVLPIDSSFHNFGIVSLGDRFSPLAHSKDGLVEAFSHEESPIFGMMWHPEREAMQSKASTRILNLFCGSL